MTGEHVTPRRRRVIPVALILAAAALSATVRVLADPADSAATAATGDATADTSKAPLTGMLSFGASGAVRLVVPNADLAGPDPRLHVQLVNEGEETFTILREDTWLAVLSDGRRVTLAPRTEPLFSPDGQFDIKSDGDDAFRRAAAQPYDTVPLGLVPSIPTTGTVASIELRLHDRQEPLVAADRFQPAREKLVTPMVLPEGFVGIGLVDLRVCVWVGEDGRPGRVRISPGLHSETIPRPDAVELLQATIANWTFEPALRNGRPERSVLEMTFRVGDHRVVRRDFAMPQSELLPSLAGFLHATFPFVVELPEAGGFVVASPIPVADREIFGARAWLIRTGDESGRTWINIASRTLMSRDPVRGMKCGCDLWVPDEDAPARLMDRIVERLGLAPGKPDVLLPIAWGMIPSGRPEPATAGSWQRDGIHKLLEATLAQARVEAKASKKRKKDVRKDATRPEPAARVLPSAAEILPQPEKRDPRTWLQKSTWPRLVRKVAPDYPKVERMLGTEGHVVVEATVDETGTVVSTELVQSVRGLNLAAVDAICCWRYKPGTIDGKPVPVVITVLVNFDLRF